MKFIISSTSGDTCYFDNLKTTMETHRWKSGRKAGWDAGDFRVIEISSLEELMKLVKVEDIVISAKWYDIPEIEIYDSWRE